MKQILQTQHLTLREFTLDDWAFVKDLVNSEGWLKFIGDRQVHDEESAKQYLSSRYLANYAAHNPSLWLVQLTDTATPIGTCGLIKREELEEVDIGFAFLPEFAGQGYGFESASAVMRYGFEQLKLSKIVAITLPENIASIALCKRLGMQYEREIMHEGDLLFVYGKESETLNLS